MRRRVAPVLVALVAFAPAAFLGGCRTTDQDETSAPESRDPAAVPFEQGRTLACLRRSGATVKRLGPSDPGLRDLRDLAQRTSFSIRADGEQVALAFGRDIAAAELLEELLAVPDRSYAVIRRGNVVVLYRRGEPTTLRLLADCVPA